MGALGTAVVGGLPGRGTSRLRVLVVPRIDPDRQSAVLLAVAVALESLLIGVVP